ncbi:MAG: hypothetical protein OWT28_03745 [Firmicutes bacterium]|nr:hypothetical protein [Bacillota bacterium]
MKLAPWIDEWTAEQIGLISWTDQMRPQSVYGQICRRDKGPFLPGDESDWHVERRDIEQVSQALTQDEERARRLWAQFQGAPDISDSVQLLQRSLTLSLEQVAALKRFAKLQDAITRWLFEQQVTLSFWHVAQVDAVLTACGQPESAAFSLQDLDDRPLREAQAVLQPLRAALQAERQAFVRALGQLYLTPLRRDQTLILSVDASQLATARQDPRLQVRMETPWEVVFDPVWPEALLALSAQEELAQAQVAEAEQEALRHLSAQLRAYAAKIAQWPVAFGRFDEISARALFALNHASRWTTHRHVVSLGHAVHPAVERPTPIDLHLARPVTVLVGPNMGGKTVAQKTVLLLQACHQLGFPIPAVEGTTYEAPLFRSVRYVGGDTQSITSGLSSFGAEMVSLQLALTCTQVLMCLDELGRTTNPQEGQALVEAVLAHLKSRTDVIALVATHFPIRTSGCGYVRVSGLREDREQWPQGLSLEERLAWLRRAMDYRLIACLPWETSQVGLQIAGWLGLEPAIVNHAQTLLAHGSESGDCMSEGTE